MRSVQTTERIHRGSSRLFAVDALRGLIIILMALDHASLFIAHKHSPGEYWGTKLPFYQDSLAFLTRFITHLSAPGFFFLMGVGMLLFTSTQLERGWGRWAVIRHFLIRGGILIAIQLLVVNQAWMLSGGAWPEIYIGVLFALGSAMILSSLLMWLRPRYLVLIGTALLIATGLLVPDPELWGTFQFTHPVNYINLILVFPGGNGTLWSNYPVLPWLGLVIFGILFGHWIRKDQQQAFDSAWKIGLGLLLAFVLIRYLNGFGNIQPRIGNTWIDYLNLVKYPPSLAFTLLTLGINLILLGLFARANDKLQTFFFPLVVYGRAPLFFYVVHLFLYAALGIWFTPEGTSLPAMYPFWLLGLLLIFPVCLLFGRFKQQPQARRVLRFF
jgi:uncharacterized membrane protein